MNRFFPFEKFQKRFLCCLFFGISVFSELPANAQPLGHPNIGGSNAGTFSPKNTSTTSAKASPGTIEVEILNPQGQPLADVEVDLISSFQSIAQGPREEITTKSTDSSGKVSFSDLQASLRYDYAVVAKQGDAHFGVPSFRLAKSQGQSVRIYVYPTTNSISDAFVGIRGFLYLTQREDFLNVELMFRVMSLGRKAWVPKNLLLQLPKDFQGVDVPLGEGDARFERASEGVILKGTYPPGQRDIRFSFMVPRNHRETQMIQMDLPPRVAELRGLTEALPGLELDVPGFEKVQRSQGPGGEGTVLITRKLMRPGEAELKSVLVELRGLPTRGPERWIATLVAALIALAGLFLLLRNKTHQQISDGERQTARSLILEELVALENARTERKIGPKTYQKT
ncbi:MAG: hypothetical protein MK135_00960, partial [Polyangiaceae bacterium]|nr:hypothetical protein [Polyangiaceae bacterium]